MDQVVIFKEGESLKSHLEGKRLSFTRSYRMTHATMYQQVGKVITDHGEDILLYYVADQLTSTDILRLQHLRIKHPAVKITLCADDRYALQAWRLDLFHFESLSAETFLLKPAYHKYTRSMGGTHTELVITKPEGLSRLPFHHINFLKADGNYTEIHLKGDKRLVQTKQLGKFSGMLEQDAFIRRVHRSLILNMRNVRAVSKDHIAFYNSKGQLKVSASLAKKVKAILIAK